jgi:hypothetical protein
MLPKIYMYIYFLFYFIFFLLFLFSTLKVLILFEMFYPKSIKHLRLISLFLFFPLGSVFVPTVDKYSH